MIRSYKDLAVYEKSYQAALRMYRQVSKYPREELYGLTSQIKRAATSIPLNIAEGYGKRDSTAEFKRYLLMASGSVNEMEVLLELSKDLGFMQEQEYEAEVAVYQEIGRMLGGLLKKWESI